VKVWEIAHFLNRQIVGNKHKDVLGVASLRNAGELHLTFCNDKTNKLLNETKATVICDSEAMERKTFILSQWPKYDFARATNKFFKPEYVNKCYIGKNGFIHPSAQVNDEGVNCARGPDGMVERLPHLGGLIIEDNVHIAALTTVQRGVLEDTIIEEGTTIGPNCNIGHGVHIGKHCVITGMNFIGGSSKIGNRVYVAPHCTVKNGVQIGDGAFIGMGSLVLNDVAEGVTVVGRPAVLIEQFKSERERLKWLFQE
jgi:UDP-3-O-[3-hydroxymyristoyl] glucosamine N-acyltransferase